MPTTRLLHDTAADIAIAAALLRGGEVVAIPTETVYGLAANALDGRAVSAIFAAKGRPADNPLIVHIASLNQLPPLVRELPSCFASLAARFWPGALTVILPRSEQVPSVCSGGLDTVAVRMPSHPTALAVIEAAGLPLAAPSANRSGRPSPTSAAHVLADLDGRIAAVLDGGDCGIGVESTVLDLTVDPPAVLRPGAVTPEALRELLPQTAIHPAAAGQWTSAAPVPSPGMKYTHYAPRAAVTLVRGDFAAYVNRQRGCVAALCYDGEEAAVAAPSAAFGRRGDPTAQARRLYAALREADRPGVERIFVPFDDSMGLAVRDRLLRAAGGNIITG